ncbi:uncharacterized protein FIBRA_08240 [Fibroporia radiculosa]|uniref:Uncharacterized protein n=1 Tax=Fibroporia radiculosa TaxID=599839 RepID=J4I2E8_9APHY|nr:uncharacterized protein FIBRA_08240 [Fibroporia radiculosa]CCM05997.1 predicted protein [Fibroporia radiculosa]
MIILFTGSIYFLVFLTLNVTEIIMWSTNTFKDISFVTQFLNSILISRFYLNLREEVHGNGLGPDTSVISDVNFAAQVVGNMGSTLDHGSQDFEAFEVEEDASHHGHDGLNGDDIN